jgi:DNA-binding LytR/AlgR family response regulator
MHHIGIVDDDARSRDVVLRHLRRYQDEHHEQFAVRVFGDGDDLVRGYPADLDILFLDVEMPGMGGFEAAHAVREVDDSVVIVFITRMGQLAIRGYEVGALNYLVKPLRYTVFAQELTRCLRRVRRSTGTHLMLPTARGSVRVDAADVTHVGSTRHRITVHTVDAAYTFTGTLKVVEAMLPEDGFFRASSSYLVNLRHVLAVHRTSCVVAGGHEVPISRARKRDFLEALTDHVGGRVC